MKKYFFAVDLGATSGRTILAVYDGERVALEEVSRFSNPQLPIANKLYWDLPGLYHQILEGLRKVAQRGIPLTSIGIDTWGCDVAPFAADGSLAGLPECYRNAHLDGAPSRFSRQMPLSEVYARTGIQIMDFNTLFQFAEMPDDLKARTAKFLFIPDALSYMLTGVAVTERTVASTSGMANPVTGRFDTELVAKAGLLGSQLSPTTEPGTVIGALTPQAQEYTGLGAVPVVAVAGHDTASAVAGIPSTDDDFAYLSCGTWSLIGVETAAPVVTAASRQANYTNEGGVLGTVRFLKNICGMWLFEQCRKAWGTTAPDVATLAASARQSSCQSVIDPDDTSLAHPASMPGAIAALCRASGQSVPQSYGDFVRVIYRSLAARYAAVAATLTQLTAKPIRRLHVIGGGSQSAPLMQMTADKLRIPVVAGPVESTALGNVLMQLHAAGLAPTLADMRHISANSSTTKTYQPS